MCEQCRRDQQQNDDAVRWLAMLLRRVGMLFVVEVENRYDLEPSVRTKKERERRARDKVA